VDEAPRSSRPRYSGDAGLAASLRLRQWTDGPDILVADGHIENEIERVQKRVSYAEAPHLSQPWQRQI